VSLVEGGVTVSVLPFDVDVGAIDEPLLPRPLGYPDDPRYPSNGFFEELGIQGSGYAIHPLVAVPEPSSGLLLTCGMLGLAALTLWRKARPDRHPTAMCPIAVIRSADLSDSNAAKAAGHLWAASGAPEQKTRVPVSGRSCRAASDPEPTLAPRK
jgi:hypothetical protein